MTLFVALASGSPVAAIFGQSEPVGSNTISSGTVAAPVLTGLTPQLSPCRVNLSWTAPSGGIPPDGYDIDRATASGGPYTFRKHVGAVTSAADDSGPLAALTTYYYRLRSTRSGWTSVDSNVMSVTTLLCAL